MKITTKNLTITALFTALTFVVTRFIQIPIPLGYFNIGNVIILIACMIVPMPYGIIIGAVGSALADLLSYPVYTLPTLVIKALMPLVFYFIVRKHTNKTILIIVAAAVATLIPLFGYTLVGGILYGGFLAGLSQFPGLLMEYIANLILFAIAAQPVKRIAYKKA